MIANWRWWKSNTKMKRKIMKWLIVILAVFIVGCGPVGWMIPALGWGSGTSIIKAIIVGLGAIAGGFGLGRWTKK